MEGISSRCHGLTPPDFISGFGYEIGKASMLKHAGWICALAALQDVEGCCQKNYSSPKLTSTNHMPPIYVLILLSLSAPSSPKQRVAAMWMRSPWQTHRRTEPRSRRFFDEKPRNKQLGESVVGYATLGLGLNELRQKPVWNAGSAQSMQDD